MKFEWDEDKRESNIEKHGIDFVDATMVFFDIDKIEKEDQRKSYGEKRYQLIGKVEDIILFVVFTLRGEDIRIISARVAHEKERKEYISCIE